RRVKRLTVSHAFHSVLMEPMLAEFGEVAGQVEYRRPRVPIVSNVTGEPVEEYTGEYWVRHVREAVRFADGVATLHGLGVTKFLEIGPEGVLTALAQQCLPGASAVLAATLRGKRVKHGEPGALLRGVAKVYTHGVDVDWRAVYAPWGGGQVELPTYAFQRQRYWMDAVVLGGLPAGDARPADETETRFWEAVESEDLNTLAETLRLAPEDGLDNVLPALSAWRKDRRERSVLDSWRYQVSWTPLEA
ncbi:acyltransferase domain-containing protein, partial [Spongiactinospora sp. TRM90649]|uniref:acyltransferase domain-containing protein n=1 Tax=Spongiactinospora sp. TRM90649 TaxID=3031114 RepID=UPI003211B637|nr:hypothetical protein [Spongiactinospora sp. TRM90649]